MPTTGKLFLGGTQISGENNAALVGFTGSTSFTVPDGCTSASVLVVGGGQSATGSPGGRGGQVVTQNVLVTAGEILTVVVGSTNETSSISGSFGTVSDAGGSSGLGASGNGTYVSGFGWYGGGGGTGNPGDPFNNCSPGGYGGGGGVSKTDGGLFIGQAGAPNSGGGGGGGTSPAAGGSGFVGIFVK